MALALGGALGLPTSTEIDLRRAALLIAGFDLMIAGLAAKGPPRKLQLRDSGSKLTSLLSGAIADSVMMFAIAAAAVIAFFGDSEPIERLGYFLALLVVAPLCVVLAWNRERRGLADERQQFMAFATLVATAGALCAARLLASRYSGALGTSLFLLLELLAARGVIALAGHFIPLAWLRRFPSATAIALTPVLLVVSASPFVPTQSFTLSDVVPLALALAAFCLVSTREIHRVSRAGTFGADAVILTLSTLVVFLLAAPGPANPENQSYFLGPAIDVLHGHPMLVDTFSQYGVGNIDALAAVFLLVPIGYGTFTLLLSTSTVLFFALYYLILRWSTKSLLLAATGLATAVILDVFGQLGFYIYEPSTGVLRFGLPWLVVLCSLAAARSPRHRRLFEALVLAVVAVASVWSGEDGVYCLCTAGAIVCLEAAVAGGSAGERVLKGIRRVALLITASVSSIVLFTLVTRLATGVWPYWGGYLEYIKLYTLSDFGDLPIDPWSPGLAIGAIYTASAVVIVLLVMSRPALVREGIVAFRAVTGLTVFGALAYTYFLGRSHPNNLIHISPPAVALLFIWLDIARSSGELRATAAVVSAAAVLVGGLIITSETGNIGLKYQRTALGAVMGVAQPLNVQLSTMWRNPLAEPGSTPVVRFVHSLGERGTSLTFLLAPNVETDVLLNLGAANALPSSNPAQESISPGPEGRIAEAVRSMRPGGILVTSESEQVLPIQSYTLSLLRKRFALREIASDGQELQAYLMTALR